jgi:hypothetical protein
MATEPPPRSRIVYSKLSDPAKYIRLLKVEADHTNAPRSGRIRISIRTTFFDHTLLYHAVSYAWGSSLEEQEITLDTGEGEESMTVRRNCADVLRQLARFKTTMYYWVDAICINPSDQHEKSVQVDMMGDIFRQAECVLACIGMPRGDGRSLTQWLRGFPPACFPKRTHNDSEQGMELHLRLSKRWLDGIPAAQIVRFAKALDEVAKLPYFTRVWILQKLFLARRLKVYYGFEELSLSTLLFWWQQLRPDLSTPARDENSPLLYKKLCSTATATRSMRTRPSATHSHIIQACRHQIPLSYGHGHQTNAYMAISYAPAGIRHRCHTATATRPTRAWHNSSSCLLSAKTPLRLHPASLLSARRNYQPRNYRPGPGALRSRL